MSSNVKSPQAPACLHCGLPSLRHSSFCCPGCESVYSLLMERNLGHFYKLREANSFRPPAPAPDPSTLNSDSPFEKIASRSKARFYLQGIHCLGCLWLLEKLPEIEPRILEARLDMAHNILEVKIQDGEIGWAEVSGWISRLGYQAKALDEGEKAEDARKQEHGAQLLRLGVAAFGAGNIMLLTISIYAGADPLWSRNFAWLSALLAAPVLLYSAGPLYLSAFGPLRRGQLSIDLAIVIALLAGIATSIASLLRGEPGGIYFDSLSMLVFLLLSSRYLLQRMRESLASSAPCLAFQENERFERTLPKPARVSASDLKPGDEIQLRTGQVLPVDAILLEPGNTYLDLSLLTGESIPVKFRQQERVEAGSKLEGKASLFRVASIASESRLSGILQQIRAYELHRSPSVDFADRIGRRFVLAVLGLFAILLFWNPSGEGLSRALALAIVTCPCVLAFAIPLTLTRSLQKAARRGILFRDSARMETLASAKQVFLDKTGTLTTGLFSVKEWKRAHGSLEEAKAAAVALERHSSHPIARAVLRDTNPENEIPNATEVKEVQSYGISGNIAGKEWKVVRSETPSSPGENCVEILCDGILRAELVLGDALRPEAPLVLQELEKLGLSVHLLSGDSAINTGAIAWKLGIPSWQAGLKPEDKARILSESAQGGTIMVGDGANDAVAFRAADVSIAMQGAVELSLRHSDILLTRPGLASLLDSILLARSTMRLVKQGFALTLAYNLLAGSLAVAGMMQPLLAAILMPMSALSVFAYISWRTGTLPRLVLPSAELPSLRERRAT